MLKFYYSTAPNPMKVALFLEESGTSYEAIPVDTRKGDQHTPAYLAINPNAKVPAIVDGDAVVFDSSAILLYLGEKTGQYMPPNTPKARGELFSWMMFIASGLGPFGGQAVHFKVYAPEKIPYAIDRYVKETNRLYGVLNKRLEDREYIAGEYSIADMMSWPWIVPYERQGQKLEDFPHLKRWFETMKARPGVAKGYAVGKELRAPAMSEEAKKILFGQTAAVVQKAAS